MRARRWVFTIQLRFRSLFKRTAADSELDDELQFHLDQKTQEFISKGLSENDARYAARREFNGVEQSKENCRDARKINWIHDFAQDLRFGARMLRKNPGFTAVAVLTLALGIGANTAIFSATYGILLKQLPYPDASRLIEFRAVPSGPDSLPTKYLSDPEIDEISLHCSALAQSGGYSPVLFTLTNIGEPENLSGMEVFGDFFSVFQVPPLLGRAIQPADSELGADQVVILSYSLWQNHFGGDSTILGKQIILTAVQTGAARMLLDHALIGKPYIVVGVMPPSSKFPLEGAVWIPWARTVNSTYTGMMGKSERGRHSVAGVARLRPGTTLNEANAQLHTIAAKMAAAYPDSDKGWDLSAVSLRDSISEGYSAGLLLLLGAVSFVLLLACVSMSSLLIARSWARQSETAIRQTLGATRGRLIRQFLSESVLLSVMAGSLGFLLAFSGVRLLRIIAPPGTPRLNDVGLNWLVLVYTMGISFVVGIVFGLAPALRLTGAGLNPSLKESGSGNVGNIFSRRPHRARGLLVISEIALAFLLVTGSALAIRSFEKLIHVDLGYRTDHILTMMVKLSSATCPKMEVCTTNLDRVIEKTRALPGVEAATISSGRPFSVIFSSSTFEIEGAAPSSVSADDFVVSRIVTPEYFRAMEIPLMAGRSFSSADVKNSVRVAVVNEAMAHDQFSGNPIGKRFRSGWSRVNWIEVVGVVKNTRDMSASERPRAGYYTPLTQAEIIPDVTLLVRTAADPMSIASAVREQVWSVDKSAPITEMATMEQVVSNQVAEPRFQTLLLTAFAALGLALALVGIYGVISHAMSRRTHEIGVRIALGAQRRDILRLVLGEGMITTGTGIAVGAAAALALTRVLRTILFEVTPTDPATYVGVTLLIAASALAAYYVPARRAARVDPMVALRNE